MNTYKFDYLNGIVQPEVNCENLEDAIKKAKHFLRIGNKIDNENHTIKILNSKNKPLMFVSINDKKEIRIYN